MSFSSCSNDVSLGPQVIGCRDDFDFTVKFEQLVFSVVPASIYMIVAVWRLLALRRKPVVISGPYFQFSKLIFIVIYAAFELALLVLTGLYPFTSSEVAIAASVLRLCAAICMIIISALDHARSVRPSIVLSAYLFITVLLDITQARTLWLASMTGPERTYTAVFSTTLAIKVIVLLLEAQHKTRWSKLDTKDRSPEESSGMYSLGVFFWLNKLFLLGYRKILQIRDLYPLDQSLAAAHAQELLGPHLDVRKLKDKKYGLLRALARTLITYIVLPVPFRICMTVFTFCQPLFIESLLSYLSLSGQDSSQQQGYGLIGASGLIYLGIAISTAFYWYFQYRMIAAVRACLVSSIYKQATGIRITTGDDGAALTLMSTDIERIIMGLRMVHELWACLIETAVASWLLYLKIGPAFATPLISVIVCAGMMSVLVRYTGDSQKAWMQGVQKRVGLTSTVIASMKNLKISGLAVPISEYVQKLRDDELASGSNFRMLGLVSAIIAYIPVTVSPFITFALAGDGINATRLFTSLAFIMLVAQPFSLLFQFIPQLVSCVACLDRIQSFLEQEPREDFRRFSALVDSPDTLTEKSKMGANNDKSDKDTVAIQIDHADFGWEVDNMALSDISMRIPRSQLTIVVGPIASGKSTLCKALLGEIPFMQRGTVTFFTSTTTKSRTGFCEQAPFLSNATIRENITGFSAFDPVRYAEVIDATMLEADFDTLQLRDRTNVGSNGITLSGGQKQRVALARALYLQTDLLILDDVFSGLDADTEDRVFQRVFNPVEGLLTRRRATVVLCTHSVRHLPFSHHIVALGPDGTVVEQGTFEKLDAGQGYIRSLEIKPSSSSSVASDAESEIASPTGLQGSEASAIKTNPAVKADLMTKVISVTESIIDGAQSSQDHARQTGDKTVYAYYARSIGSSVATSFVLFAVVYGAFSSFPAVWLTFWTQDTTSTSAGAAHSFAYWIGLYTLFQTLGLLGLATSVYAIFISGVRKSGANLHRDALRTVIHAPLRYFTTTDQGVTTNLFSQDINIIDTQLPMGLMNVVLTAFQAVGQAVIMCTASPYLAVGYPFLLALMWAIQKFYLRTSRQLRILDLEAKSPLYTHFLDTTKGLVTLRAHGQVHDNRIKNTHLLDTSQRPEYLLFMIQHWLQLVLHLMVMGLALLLVGLAVSFRSSAGFTGASLVTMMTFSENLMVIVKAWTIFETSIGAIARLRALVNTVKPEDREEEDVCPQGSWPPRGEISLDGVSASYGTDSPNNAPPLALNEVTLTIRPGEKVAICGRTGSGKSSLIALLLKLLDPTPETSEGAVRIDGLDIGTIDRQTLRHCIISVPQDTVFLPDGTSFQENVDPLGTATAEDARVVLETVGLWTFVEEHGGLGAGLTADAFSQGQRQLFSLARAVLRKRLRAREVTSGLRLAAPPHNSDSSKASKTPLSSKECGDVHERRAATGDQEGGGIILLDEVSSSVDQHTERTMQEIIAREFRSYTVVAVSHRLDMIMGFDRVVVMDRGCVVEVGNPRELVAQGNDSAGGTRSRFGDLYALGGKA